MIPAVSAPRQDGKSSFAALHKYLTVERQPGTKEFVERGPIVLSKNLLGLETAAIEMRVVASQSRRVSGPIMHFQLAWKPGEKPTQAQWQASAERAIEALGFTEHQYVIVAHDDKKHFHVHVMLNRVDPETLKAHNPRLSLLTLHKVARELEHEFGWAETAGLFHWDPARNQAVRTSRRELKAHRLDAAKTRGSTTVSVAKQDHFRDASSVKAFASKQPAERLRKLLSTETHWAQIHLTLAQHGLTLNKAEKGGYTVGVEGSEIRVKASDVFRFAFSGKDARAKLEWQLGPYQPAKFGPLLNAPVVDYDRAVAPKKMWDYASAAESNRRSRARLEHPRSLNDIPTLSKLRSLGENTPNFDRVEIRTVVSSPVERRPRVQVVVRPGNMPGSASSHGSRPPAVPSSHTPEERRKEWLRKQAEAGQQRRQQRLEERNRERDELKREYLVVRAENQTALHQHVLSARARRTELAAVMQRVKAVIRQQHAPWPLKKLLLAEATKEYVQSKQWLTATLQIERNAIGRPTYAEWVEERANASDQRAVAQMRGWRYQDQRNLRHIERSALKRAGELAPDNAAEDPAQLSSRSDEPWQCVPCPRKGAGSHRPASVCPRPPA